MSDNLRINSKFIGFKGVIGRRDYTVNLFYAVMLAVLFAIPWQTYFFCNMNNFSDVLHPFKLAQNAPVLLNIWTILSAAFVLYIETGNSIRRLNDIFDKENKIANILVSVSMIFMTYFVLYAPLKYSAWILVLYYILYGILIFKKGKTTGNLPYDFTKEFNWGTYFGTWIWGLINKSYKTLWIIPLSLTPLGFYYQIICGFKGNEWAWKNKKWNDYNAFRRSQEKQTIVFVILGAIVLPVLIMMVFFIITFGIIFALSSDSANFDAQKATQKLEKSVRTIGSIYFEGNQITDNENKFYVSSKDWDKYSFKEKKNMLDIAASIAAMERNNKSPNSMVSYTKGTELTRTKIYSSDNKKLLGEFYIDTKLLTSNPDAKTVFKQIFSAYRFYSAK